MKKVILLSIFFIIQFFSTDLFAQEAISRVRAIEVSIDELPRDSELLSFFSVNNDNASLSKANRKKATIIEIETQNTQVFSFSNNQIDNFSNIKRIPAEKVEISEERIKLLFGISINE